MGRVLIFAVSIFFIGCDAKMEKRIIGNKIVEAIFINDSMADGVVKYYTLEGKLDAIFGFKNGKNNGTAVHFFPNGKVFDSIHYLNDVANGEHHQYDKNGNLLFKEVYKKGKQVGEKFSYENNNLVKYAFADSNGFLLYTSEYNSEGLTRWKFKSIININSENVIVNGTEKKYVQFYWLKPPHVTIKYALGIADTVRHIDKTITELNRSGIIKDTILPVLNYPFCYYISAEYSDTINKFNKLYIQEF